MMGGKATVFFVWLWFACTAVWAAETNPIYLQHLPWQSILIAGAIAIWGGLTRTTLRKLDRVNLWKQAFTDAIVASGAGFVMFNLAMWAGVNIWLMSASLYLAGWLGAQFLSAAGDRLLEAVRTVGKKE